ncbi:MAG: haloacid dehalogenase-like hydrolase [Elusimicrobiota bacterium]
MARAALLAALCLVSAGAFSSPEAVEAAGRSSARPRRKSHRWDKEKGAPVKRKTEKKSKFLRLAPGRWRAPVADALERVLAENGVGIEGYDVLDPPVALLRFDDVSITNHVGEAFFYRLVTDAKFKFSKEFWERVPIQFGRQRIRAGYLGFKDLPRKIWEQDAYYRLYRKTFFAGYRDFCKEFGKTRCRSWLVQLLADFDEMELRRFARDVIKDELKHPVVVETIEEFPEDPRPVKVRRGLRFIPEMKDLYKNLHDRGIDVWIISSSSFWAAEDMAKEYGVDTTRVLGMRTKVSNGIVSAEVLRPVTSGPGGAEAISLFIGRSPKLIVGGPGDAALLRYGRGVRLRVFEPGSSPESLSRRGPLFQPRFSASRPPQTFFPARKGASAGP